MLNDHIAGRAHQYSEQEHTHRQQQLIKDLEFDEPEHGMW
jgi:hypothetical protein